jgi:exodeoxyribonuclease VII large subunit
LQDYFDKERQKLEDFVEDAIKIVERLLQHQGTHLEQARTLLEVLSPQAALKRGYAIVRNDLGGLVRTANDAPLGAIVHIEIDDDEISAKVTSTRKKGRD